MSNIIIEAIADAESLKAATVESVKEELIEMVTPRIQKDLGKIMESKSLLKKGVIKESDDENEEDEHHDEESHDDEEPHDKKTSGDENFADEDSHEAEGDEVDPDAVPEDEEPLDTDELTDLDTDNDIDDAEGVDDKAEDESEESEEDGEKSMHSDEEYSDDDFDDEFDDSIEIIPGDDDESEDDSEEAFDDHDDHNGEEVETREFHHHGKHDDEAFDDNFEDDDDDEFGDSLEQEVENHAFKPRKFDPQNIKPNKSFKFGAPKKFEGGEDFVDSMHQTLDEEFEIVEDDEPIQESRRTNRRPAKPTRRGIIESKDARIKELTAGLKRVKNEMASVTLFQKKMGYVRKLVNENFAGANKNVVKRILSEFDKASTLDEAKTVYSKMVKIASKKKKNVLAEAKKTSAANKNIQSVKKAKNVINEGLRSAMRERQVLGDSPIRGRNVEINDSQLNECFDDFKRLASIPEKKSDKNVSKNKK